MSGLVLCRKTGLRNGAFGATYPQYEVIIRIGSTLQTYSKVEDFNSLGLTVQDSGILLNNPEYDFASDLGMVSYPFQSILDTLLNLTAGELSPVRVYRFTWA